MTPASKEFNRGKRDALKSLVLKTMLYSSSVVLSITRRFQKTRFH